MGWKPFSIEPPDDELINAYVETDGGMCWIVTCKWIADKRFVQMIDGISFDDDSARVLCWRERHPLPRIGDVERLRQKPPIKLVLADY